MAAMAAIADRWRRPFQAGVRWRVTALATLAVAAVLVAAGVLLVVRQRADLVEQLDESLAVEADQLAGGLASGAPVAPSADDDRVVTLIDGERSGGGDARQIELDGEAFRAVERSIGSIDGAPPRILRLAAALDDIDESVGALVASLAWIIPLATALLATLVWLVVGRTLRPVERIRTEVAEIGLTELGRRVPEPAGDDEIARLAVTMNEMLARLEHAVVRQQQFVADAAHELRTPLARMRTELEVDARDPTGGDAIAARRSQLEEIVGLQLLTDDLLALARIDEHSLAPAAVQRVDLDDLVLDELRGLDATTIAVDGRRVSAAQVRGVRADLRRVVRNLLDNAQRHARTAIAVELHEDGDHAALIVDDDGPGVPIDRRAEVFERFTRLDPSRTTGAGGAGLGLAIVHELVARHGGTVIVTDGPLGGARFVVTLRR